MTRAKKKCGKRQTRHVQCRQRTVKRKPEDGRPRGTYKRFPFEQTRLGFLLKYEMPVVYDIVMDRYKDMPFPQPQAEVIELICKASKDISYQKPKFRRCMDEYIAWGIYCRRAKVLTEGRKNYYESIRKKKMEAFIARNRQRIEKMKRRLFNNDSKSKEEIACFPEN